MGNLFVKEFFRKRYTQKARLVFGRWGAQKMLKKNGLQEPVHLTIEKSKEDSRQHIAGTKAGEKQGFGNRSCTLQNSRQSFFHYRICPDY